MKKKIQENEKCITFERSDSETQYFKAFKNSSNICLKCSLMFQLLDLNEKFIYLQTTSKLIKFFQPLLFNKNIMSHIYSLKIIKAKLKKGQEK